MNYHKITKHDIANGEGIRVVLWVSGCNHHCKDCHNPQTWDKNSGQPFDEVAEQELFKALDHDYIAGVTFSGGDSLFPANRKTVTRLAKKIKETYPNKNIWVYTGYTMAEIKNLQILEYVDVIVDGKFMADLKDLTLKFRGSSNQKIWRKGNDNKWTESQY